ncbi:uncharacterized protein E6C27_scaffold1204G00190 [Cucumis melo var. makuwa]|uniref:Reverse transcriptase domain-containing protein n=1 Tax=Cucumis melo var. makuwa TaxID=1194695 RepID=A0A5A7SHL6_CUCMM|nr:uncharacterized protein E6C27_scaffold1204G00190 [Cucumis melo var. makuwa]
MAVPMGIRACVMVPYSWADRGTHVVAVLERHTPVSWACGVATRGLSRGHVGAPPCLSLRSRGHIWAQVWGYLGKKNTFPIIISRELNQKQEDRLIEVLKKKKQAIGWTLDDIKGISPTFCMHRIILEEGAKDKIQPQRRFNPTSKEDVMNEVLKLKDAGIIYPVPDSTWVSPIHVVLKKTG